MSDHPFPGLRAFRRDETDVFFGRESSLDIMVDRLAAHRFLAVTGASGSGKSSLVFTGLMDALERGLLAEAGSDWTILTMRPGAQPLRALAEALPGFDHNPDHPAAAPTALDIGLLRATLARGPLALKEYFLRTLNFTLDRNVLIVVDQFEELFRYRTGDEGSGSPDDPGDEKLAWREEAQAFVDLLLESAGQRSMPIYIVITLRSDFLGECTEILGLAEAINDSQFLTPRLTRDETRRAIEGPVAVYEAEIEPRLVNGLLNEMGADPDQLPLMQHALMRLWGMAKGDPKQLTHELFARHLKSLRQALCDNANGVLAELSEEQQRLAQILFRVLTEGSGSRSDRRRPTALGKIAEIADVPLEDLVPVVEAFRGTGRHFLTYSGHLSPETVIDISHESLIRQWDTLRDWVRIEFGDAEEYRRLEERAVGWRAGRPLLIGTDLLSALEWRDRERRSEPWARRYGEHFDDVMPFIEESRKRRDAEQRSKVRMRFAMAGIVAVIAIIFAWDHNNSLEQGISQANFLAARGIALRHLESGDPQRALSEILVGHDFLVDAGLPDTTKPVLQEVLASDQQLISLQGGDVINFAAFSPDGRRVVTATSDNHAYLWDATTGAPIATIRGHAGQVARAAFSPDGRYVATASDDKTARIWDAVTGKPFDHLTGRPLPILRGHNGNVTFVAYSPDGKRIVTASASPDDIAQIWDATTGEPIGEPLHHPDSVNSAVFSPDRDGKYIVTTSADGIARLWYSTTYRPVLNPTTGKPLTLSGHVGNVTSANFSPDGKRIVTASTDRTARVWNAETGALLGVLAGHGAGVTTAAFSPRGKRIVTASADGTAAIWDADTFARLAVIYGHTESVSSAAFSPDGQRILTASRDKTARIFSTDATSEEAILTGHQDSVSTAAFSPNGKYIVTASSDNTARIWSAAGAPLGKPLVQSAVVNDAVFSPDGRHIVTASNDNTALIWSAAAAQFGEPLVHSAVVNDAAFSPDGDYIVTASNDQTARVWDAKTRQPAVNAATRTPLVLSGHILPVRTAAFSPHGRRIVTASYDGTALIWDAATGQPDISAASGKKLVLAKECQKTPQRDPGCKWMYSAAFSSDGKRVVTASFDGTARVWDAATGREIGRFHSTPGYRFYSAAFSPDGRHVVTASNDKTARIWDVASGKAMLNPTTGKPLELTGHTDVVYHAEFSPDGKYVVTASNDGQARVWDASTGEQIRVLSGHTGGLRWASFSPDNQHIVTASVDQTARVWRAQDDGPIDESIRVWWAKAAQFGAPCQDQSGRSVQMELTALPPCPKSNGGIPTSTKAEVQGFVNRATHYDQLAIQATDNEARRDDLLLKAFDNYAAATELGRAKGWNESEIAVWRSRRATIARLLKADGKMKVVANEYQQIHDKYNPSGIFNQILGALFH